MIFIPIALLIGMISYFILQANQLPKHFILSAPEGKVYINRDSYNVPHIQALKSDNDAFFALGYLHAKDRLWQMEVQRRIASGRLSEIVGDTTLKQDKYLRTWGFYRSAIAAWDALDLQTKRIVHAYTLGVNAYLDKHELPLQFYIFNYKPEPWTDIDSIAWQKMMAWNLDNTWQQKIKNYLTAKKTSASMTNILFPPYPKNALTILSDHDLAQGNLLTRNNNINKINTNNNLAVDHTLEQHLALSQSIRNQLGFRDQEGKGSNAWVVSGALTVTGKPILANDVHLALTSPSLFYLAELRGPTLHVIGATIPGLPVVAIGHNDSIAWGVTHSYADTQDLYIEDKNTPLTTRQEVIHIRGHSSVTLHVKVSQHGPIISDVSDAGTVDHYVAIKWPALQTSDTTVMSFAKLNYARNWSDFVSALRYYVSPPQNFLYADTNGNIGYYLSGKIPLRSGWIGTYPIATSEHKEWQGYIPFEKLPHVYNPKRGYIAAANNKIVSDQYPYSLTFRWHVPPYRIERIVNTINSEKVSLANTKRLQMDTQSYLWRDLRHILLRTEPRDNNSKAALDILKAWNGRFDITSQGASIFAYWYQLLLQSSDQLNGKSVQFDSLFLVQQLHKNTCYSSYTQVEDCKQYLSMTLSKAVKKLKVSQGKRMINWQWGNVHHAVFEESIIGKSTLIGWLWNRRTSSPGGDFTVNVGTYEPGTMDQKSGVNYRQIIDLQDFNNSVYVIPLGQIDNPLSTHYNDQLPLWIQGQYVAMTFK